METSLDSDVLLRGYHGGFTLENNLEIRMVIGILHIVSHPRNGEERLRVWQCFLQTNRHKYMYIYIYTARLKLRMSLWKKRIPRKNAQK